MTLGHSRRECLYPVLGEDARAFLEGHKTGFAFFNGAPRRLVPDNLTAGILRPDLYGPRSNRPYGELARHYGCVIDPSRVQRPTGSRAAFYLVLAAFEERGMLGLLDEPRGRHGPLKLTPEIVAYLRAADPGAFGAQLVDLVARRFGVTLHRRTLERARHR